MAVYRDKKNEYANSITYKRNSVGPSTKDNLQQPTYLIGPPGRRRKTDATRPHEASRDSCPGEAIFLGRPVLRKAEAEGHSFMRCHDAHDHFADSTERMVLLLWREQEPDPGASRSI